MLGKSLLIFCTVVLAAGPVSAKARGDPIADRSTARSDLTIQPGGGYYPGRRSFYGYPHHRHIDGGADAGASVGRPLSGGDEGPPNLDGNYASPYYGLNYGAPYFGAAYYDRGVYYRERRD